MGLFGGLINPPTQTRSPAGAANRAQNNPGRQFSACNGFHTDQRVGPWVQAATPCRTHRYPPPNMASPWDVCYESLRSCLALLCLLAIIPPQEDG